MWVFQLENNLAISGTALILSWRGWPEEWCNHNFCTHPVPVLQSSAQNAACLSANTVSTLPPSRHGHYLSKLL